MLVTRKVKFPVSHVCRNPQLSEAENHALFGPAANAHGHGHDYVLEVTVEGPPDPVTGMVLDLKALKDTLHREVVEIYDHRFLNREVAPFDRVIPTPENIAIDIWDRLRPHLNRQSGHLYSVRIYETPDLYVDYFGRRGVMRVTRKYRFAASRRLHAETLREAENRALYGKCNNPFGHGHNYEIAVTVCGPVEARSGRVVEPALLDGLVMRQVIEPFDHRNLNAEVEAFRAVVPTSENLGREVIRRLKQNWSCGVSGGRALSWIDRYCRNQPERI